MTLTIEVALDSGPGALASVYVELEDRSYATAKRIARSVSRPVGSRSVDARAEPKSPWMYFGRAHSAIRLWDSLVHPVPAATASALRIARLRTAQTLMLTPSAYGAA